MNTSQMTLCMEKTGLLVPDSSNHNQCVVQNTTAYEYYVRIVVPADELPADGWIIEVGELHDALQFAFADSCERMAMDLCEVIEDLLDGRAIHPIRIEVRLKGANGGQMTACWERPHLNDEDIKQLGRQVGEYLLAPAHL